MMPMDILMVSEIFSDLNYFVHATSKLLFAASQTKNKGQNLTKYFALKYKFSLQVTAVTCRKNRLSFVEFCNTIRDIHHHLSDDHTNCSDGCKGEKDSTFGGEGRYLCKRQFKEMFKKICNILEKNLPISHSGRFSTISTLKYVSR